MAILRLGYALVLTLLLTATAAPAAEQPPTPPGLYDRPVLVVDPGMHTAMIRRADADAAGRWAVTGSEDKTVRVWSLTDGARCGRSACRRGPGMSAKSTRWR